MAAISTVSPHGTFICHYETLSLCAQPSELVTHSFAKNNIWRHGNGGVHLPGMKKPNLIGPVSRKKILQENLDEKIIAIDIS